ncbi:MAG: hypothetical protein ACRDRJ_13670 [Streptosporangiaceae bacterium]
MEQLSQGYKHSPAATIPGQIAPMAELGIRAYKIYMVVDSGRTYPHPVGTGMHDHGQLLEMMDTIARTGLRFIIHPHDQELMNYFENHFLSRGENTPAAYAQTLADREGVIWDTTIDLILRLAEASGCPVHIAHMQTRRSIEAVRRVKDNGFDVTCEVNHWALFLSTWKDVETLGPYAPVVLGCRTTRARPSGTACATARSTCAPPTTRPHTREEKEIGWTRMWSLHTGAPGVQYYYPLLLDSVGKGRLTLERVQIVATAPSKAFGLDGVKGALKPGWDADFVVADLERAVDHHERGHVVQGCGWTPYDGRACGGARRAHVRARPGSVRRRRRRGRHGRRATRGRGQAGGVGP